MALGSFLQILAEGEYYIYFPLRCWCFLLSWKFRRAMYAKWSEQRPMIVMQEVIGLFIGFVMSLAAIGGGIYYFLGKSP